METPLITLLVVVAIILVSTVIQGVRRRRRLGARQDPTQDAMSAMVDISPADESDGVPADSPELALTVEDTAPEPDQHVEAPSLRGRLTRTRSALTASVASLFGRGVDDAAWDGLEEALIAADVGVVAATDIVAEVRERSRQGGATTEVEVRAMLAEALREQLADADRTLRERSDGTTVWLITGVNGTGKTTTIGKLAARAQRDGNSVVLAAADTFRAAASEQLAVWGERTGATVVRKEAGADPASVAYEACDAARSHNADLLIIDTAGRLHNKQALMDELGKVKRVVEKNAGHVDETLLVLDATTGQNGIAQARAFLDAVDVTGVALTKLDGSSKGGVVIAIQRELGIPVKLVGLGESIDDLAVFDPDAFVDGLLGEAPNDEGTTT